MIRLKRFTMSITNRKGMTLFEVLASLSICTMLTIGAMEIFIFSNGYFARMQTQIELQNEARLLTMQFFRTAKDASSAVTFNSGNRIDIVRDGVTSRFEAVNNRMEFTSDITNPGSNRIFDASAIKYANTDIFNQPANNMIRMALRLQDTDGRDGPQWVDIDVSVNMRNAQ